MNLPRQLAPLILSLILVGLLFVVFGTVVDRAYTSGYNHGWSDESARSFNERSLTYADGYRTGVAQCIQDQKGYR